MINNNILMLRSLREAEAAAFILNVVTGGSLRLTRHTFCPTPPSAEQPELLRGDGASRSCPGAEGGAAERGLRPSSGRRLGHKPGMASLGAGLHLIRRRAASRSAAVERRNLLTVCRWEFLSLFCVYVTGRMKRRLQLNF